MSFFLPTTKLFAFSRLYLVPYWDHKNLYNLMSVCISMLYWSQWKGRGIERRAGGRWGLCGGDEKCNAVICNRMNAFKTTKHSHNKVLTKINFWTDGDNTFCFSPLYSSSASCSAFLYFSPFSLLFILKKSSLF